MNYYIKTSDWDYYSRKNLTNSSHLYGRIIPHQSSHITYSEVSDENYRLKNQINNHLEQITNILSCQNVLLAENNHLKADNLSLKKRLEDANIALSEMSEKYNILLAETTEAKEQNSHGQLSNDDWDLVDKNSVEEFDHVVTSNP